MKVEPRALQKTGMATFNAMLSGASAIFAATKLGYRKMTDLNELMKQAKQMQEKLQAAQETAAKAVVEGVAGAGLVRVEMTGRYQVNNVKIDETLLSEEISVIEDLLAAAVNSAVAKVAEASKGSLSDLAGGITLPDGFKMPF